MVGSDHGDKLVIIIKDADTIELLTVVPTARLIQTNALTSSVWVRQSAIVAGGHWFKSNQSTSVFFS